MNLKGWKEPLLLFWNPFFEASLHEQFSSFVKWKLKFSWKPYSTPSQGDSRRGRLIDKFSIFENKWGRIWQRWGSNEVPQPDCLTLPPFLPPKVLPLPLFHFHMVLPLPPVLFFLSLFFLCLFFILISFILFLLFCSSYSSFPSS